MRISTSQIYDSGALGVQNGQSGLYKLQNQLSTGRRILTPKDDPVAAAQALVVTQSKDVNAQYMDNQGQAKNQLALVESQLTAVITNIQNVRAKVIQAGNTGTMTQSDRAAIATELESRLSELLGIANSNDGTGEYLFSGYKGNVLPFAVDGTAAIPPAITSPVGYAGDDGERLLQVSSSRQMAVSVAGSDVFMNAKNGNGTFVTGSGGSMVNPPVAPPVFPPPALNLGTATVSAGSVLDPGLWNSAGNPGSFLVQFTVGAAGTTYQLYDATQTPPTALLAAPANYSSGQAITLANYGASVVVSGQPYDGDTFTIKSSANQSLFQTMQNLIGILRTPMVSATNSTTQYTNDLSAQLSNLDLALANVSRVQTSIGTRMQEIESLSSTSADVDIQYQTNLSDLQDLDYAKAISDFIKQQTNLEAAQKSFAQISGKSLFDYL